MSEFIETYHFTGIVIEIITFLIIGLFHPLVIKWEYYFGIKYWYVFLLLSIGGIIASLLFNNIIISASCGVFVFSSFWAIGEFFK